MVPECLGEARSTMMAIARCTALPSTDHWNLCHMNCLVDHTTIWIWRQSLARAGFPVQTTANVDRRLTAIIE